MTGFLTPTPYLTDPDLTLYVGDALEVLRTLPDGSVDCCVTSPPYWSLRDYGVDGQLGLEPTPDAYVANLVAVFREVRRVLADHGTCFVNLGDSYNNRNVSRLSSHQGGLGFESADLSKSWADLTKEGRTRLSIENGDLKEKDLVGVPWMVAFALRADGWYLRSDIIWAKPNPMPESVTDRPTKAHEYVFLLSKSPRYWFDQEAVREPSSPSTVRIHGSDGVQTRAGEWKSNHVGNGHGGLGNGPKGRCVEAGRNVRSVWTIATQPYSGAHFAVFPEELPRRCILAGCPEWVCRVCGKPRERIVESRSLNRNELPRDHPEWRPSRYDNGKAGDPQSPGPGQRFSDVSTLGWSDCGHADYRPGIVLDPFGGAGTTALVARKHGRRSILIELNETYARMAAQRLSQLSLLAEA